jgi:hypothetical protein
VGCAGCDPTGCPDFEPIRIFSNLIDNLVYVVTRRGLLSLRYRGGWQPEWRLELPWDPEAAGGLEFVDAAIAVESDSDVITLLDNAGRLATVEFFRVPGQPPVPFPEVGVLGATAVYTSGEVRLIPTEDGVSFVGAQRRSAAIRRVGTDDGPALAGLEHAGSTETTDGFISLYRAPGVYFLRTFTR